MAFLFGCDKDLTSVKQSCTIYLTEVNTESGGHGGGLDRLGTGNLGLVVGELGLLGGDGHGGELPVSKHGNIKY